jgi:hypothetical protein
MSIFKPCSGGVYKVKSCEDGGGAGGGGALSIDGFPSGVPITGFLLELHTNHQFLHSLDEFIYVFPFGDRIGELTVSGISFLGAEECDGGGSPCGVFEYYLKKRLSKPDGFTPSLIELSDCNGVLLGFLTGMRLQTLKPELPIVQWVLRYNVIIGS